MGHEIAARLAEPYLSPSARKAVEALLGKETLASASTWADRMRSDPSTFWQEEAGPYHYVTVPDGRRYQEVGPPPQGDAATALAQFALDLQDPNVSRERKRLALRFAVHIVQDLQQPLHVGNGRDRGGNQISVMMDGSRVNLHRVWDALLLESRQRTQDEWLSYFRNSALLRQPEKRDADPLVWIAESAALRESLYPVPATINAAYLRRELPRAEARLAQAGIRTAAWLNATLEEDSDSKEGSTLEITPSTSPKKSWWRRILDGSFR
ncbi:S1/P1 nuclease [Congregibacter sp.]|uniref:S1/P1 nuclease n=1 Tax=Congregibacter sp. TaxID=2744308 RepID=UPI003F6AD010